jgi:hypothetical protein
MMGCCTLTGGLFEEVRHKRLFTPESRLWGLPEELEGRREVIIPNLAQDNGPKSHEK